jgi:hypothetical protein
MRYIVLVTSNGVIKTFSCPETPDGVKRKLKYTAHNGIDKYGMGFDPVILTRIFVGASELEGTIEALQSEAINHPNYKGKSFFRKKAEIGTADHNYDSGHWR